MPETLLSGGSVFIAIDVVDNDDFNSENAMVAVIGGR